MSNTPSEGSDGTDGSEGSGSAFLEVALSMPLPEGEDTSDRDSGREPEHNSFDAEGIPGSGDGGHVISESNSAAEAALLLRRYLDAVRSVDLLPPDHDQREAYIRMLLEVQPYITFLPREQVLEMFDSVITECKRVAEWPTEPVPIPSEDCSDPSRLPKVMYHMYKQAEFIKLTYANPLPPSGGLIQCDGCLRTSITAGYQAVQDDGKRDRGKYYHGDEHLIGWDLCVRCADKYLTTRNNQLAGFVLNGAPVEVGNDDTSSMKPILVQSNFLQLAKRFTVSCLSCEFVEAEQCVRLCCRITPEGSCACAWAVRKSEVEKTAFDKTGTAVPTFPGRRWATSATIRKEDSEQEDGEAAECVICFEEMSTGHGECVTTPCGHRFHAQCLRRAARMDFKMACPLCRADKPLAADATTPSGSPVAPNAPKPSDPEDMAPEVATRPTGPEDGSQPAIDPEDGPGPQPAGSPHKRLPNPENVVVTLQSDCHGEGFAAGNEYTVHVALVGVDVLADVDAGVNDSLLSCTGVAAILRTPLSVPFSRTAE